VPKRTGAKKSKKLSANASEEEIAAFQDACDKVELPPSDALRDLARAFVLHVEKNKEVVKPMRLR
jgi:hypothetical protein